MTDWALVIGVNEYEHMRNLNFAVRDAQRIRDYFQQRTQQESRGRDRSLDRVFYFADDAEPIEAPNGSFSAKPVRGNVLPFLHEFFEQPALEDGDNFWFFFSGHGMWHEGSDYLMLKDGYPGLLDDTAVKLDDIVQKMRNSGADNIILLLDSCRTENKAPNKGLGPNEQLGVVTISACSPKKDSYEIEPLQQGAFTWALLEALHGEVTDNCATVERLCRYVRKRVPELNRLHKLPEQIPYTRIEPEYKSNLILLPKFSTDSDLAALREKALKAELDGNLEDARRLYRRVQRIDSSDRDTNSRYEGVLRKIWERELANNLPVPPQSNAPAPAETGASKSPQAASAEPAVKPFDRTLASLQQLRDRVARRLGLRGLELSPEVFQAALQEILAEPELEDFETDLDAKAQERWTAAIRGYQAHHLQGKTQADGFIAPGGPTYQALSEDAVLTATRLLNSPVTDPPAIEPPPQPKPEPELQPLTVEVTTLTVEETEEPKLVPLAVEVATIAVEETPKERPATGSSTELQVREVKVPTVDRSGKVIKTTKHRVRYLRETLVEDGPVLEMMAIPAGKFSMGSPAGVLGFGGEAQRSSCEGLQHEVMVRDFYLAKYPVTQAQWQFVAGLPQIVRRLELKPSQFDGDNRPVEQVDWWDAVEFCARLSQHLGQAYRLPSEAEWEYACRAGTTTPFYFGETLTSDLANYDARSTYGDGPKGQYRKQTKNVGSFPPSTFGLCDMHGNVWEWCADPWHDSYKDAPASDRVWDEKAERYEDLASNLNELLEDNRLRVRRGGSWNYLPWNCRSAFRLRVGPGARRSSLGFRVARSAPSTPQSQN